MIGKSDTRCPRPAPPLTEESGHGLPELNCEAIRRARIVGTPGCYATAVQLGFMPSVEAGVVDRQYLIADAKSESAAAIANQRSIYFSRGRPITSWPMALPAIGTSRKSYRSGAGCGA